MCGAGRCGALIKSTLTNRVAAVVAENRPPLSMGLARKKGVKCAKYHNLALGLVAQSNNNNNWNYNNNSRSRSSYAGLTTPFCRNVKWNRRARRNESAIYKIVTLNKLKFHFEVLGVKLSLAGGVAKQRERDLETPLSMFIPKQINRNLFRYPKRNLTIYFNCNSIFGHCARYHHGIIVLFIYFYIPLKK